MVKFEEVKKFVEIEANEEEVRFIASAANARVQGFLKARKGGGAMSFSNN